MGENPLILFQDEARFGRIGDVRKSWSPKGIRPVCKSQFVREYIYLYAAVSPTEGEMFSLILPEASTEAMNIYCMELSNNYPDRNILMFMDKAGWHISKNLKLPDNLSNVSSMAKRNEQAFKLKNYLLFFNEKNLIKGLAQNEYSRTFLSCR